MHIRMATYYVTTYGGGMKITTNIIMPVCMIKNFLDIQWMGTYIPFPEPFAMHLCVISGYVLPRLVKTQSLAYMCRCHCVSFLSFFFSLVIFMRWRDCFYKNIIFSFIIISCFSDWGPKVDVVGFCFLDLASNYEPPQQLMDWLNAGPKPIYLGFGSLVSLLLSSV